MFEKEFKNERLSKNIELQDFLFRCFPATLICMYLSFYIYTRYLHN